MFDYVIVGGGSAGCVIAARLAEDPGARVLLLEAGPDAGAVDEVHVPAGYSRLFRSQYDWNYVTLPQERADARAVYWPRGRVLGGSSAMNAMIYIRGNRARLRRLARRLRLRRVGLQGAVPVLPRAEDNSRRREPVSRRGRTAPVQDLRHKSEHDRALHRGRHPARRGRQRRLQRGAAGRRRLLPGHPAGRPPVQRRRRLPGQQPKNLTVVTDALVTGVADRGRPRGRRHLPHRARKRPPAPRPR